MKKILFFLACITLSSCVIVAPLMNSFQETGSTQGDREVLFQKASKEFHLLEATRNPEQAAIYAMDDIRTSMANAFRKKSLSERVVESSVRTLEFQDNSRKAVVIVTKKFFRVPQYMVKERNEKETWIFVSATEGWKIRSIELVS